jgi:Arc/MetJ family transcription regulator
MKKSSSANATKAINCERLSTKIQVLGVEKAVCNVPGKFPSRLLLCQVLVCVYSSALVHIMRTNIEIDDQLMADALRLTGASTKREVVELALRTLLRMHWQKEIRDLRGKLHWQGELDDMRTDK